MKKKFLILSLLLVSLNGFSQIEKNLSVEASIFPLVVAKDIKYDKFYLNYNAGVFIEVVKFRESVLFKYFGVRTGVQYNSLKFDVIPLFNDAGPTPISESYNYRAISVPLNLIFSFQNSPKVKFFTYMGLYPTYLFLYQQNTEYENGDKFMNNLLGVFSNINGGINLCMEIRCKSLGIGLEAIGVTDRASTLNLTFKYSICHIYRNE